MNITIVIAASGPSLTRSDSYPHSLLYTDHKTAERG